MKKLLLIPFILSLLPAIPFLVFLRFVGYPGGFAYEPIRDMVLAMIKEIGK